MFVFVLDASAFGSAVLLQSFSCLDLALSAWSFSNSEVPPFLRSSAKLGFALPIGGRMFVDSILSIPDPADLGAAALLRNTARSEFGMLVSGIGCLEACFFACDFSCSGFGLPLRSWSCLDLSTSTLDFTSAGMPLSLRSLFQGACVFALDLLHSDASPFLHAFGQLELLSIVVDPVQLGSTFLLQSPGYIDRATFACSFAHLDLFSVPQSFSQPGPTFLTPSHLQAGASTFLQSLAQCEAFLLIFDFLHSESLLPVQSPTRMESVLFAMRFVQLEPFPLVLDSVHLGILPPVQSSFRLEFPMLAPGLSQADVPLLLRASTQSGLSLLVVTFSRSGTPVPVSDFLHSDLFISVRGCSSPGFITFGSWEGMLWHLVAHFRHARSWLFATDASFCLIRPYTLGSGSWEFGFLFVASRLCMV